MAPKPLKRLICAMVAYYTCYIVVVHVMLPHHFSPHDPHAQVRCTRERLVLMTALVVCTPFVWLLLEQHESKSLY